MAGTRIMSISCLRQCQRQCTQKSSLAECTHPWNLDRMDDHDGPDTHPLHSAFGLHLYGAHSRAARDFSPLCEWLLPSTGPVGATVLK